MGNEKFLQKIINPIIIILILTALVLLGSYPDFSTILGGIALFLIGMEYMENGFKSLSGGVLEKILKQFTSNTIKAITTGFVSTAIVQSSSLISIIVISFLGAELITLASAIGVIFGSNLGTTATAWLVSLFGLKIKISIYAMPMLVMGIMIPLLLKDRSYRGFASILIGLGVIFLGIGYMKEGFETLKEGIDLAAYAMDGYAGIFVYVLVGAVATVVIQSSSATMALIITALATGQIEYANALALAIGANLGTTVTAVLGALKSNENGKRLAVAHFIFNMITGLIAIAFIYKLTDLVDYLSIIIGIDANNYAMKLALFHTIFNLLGVLVVSPFIKYLVRFLEKLFIPTTIETGTAKYLDESSLTVPDIALGAVKKELKRFYTNGYQLIAHGVNVKKSNINSELSLDDVIKDAYSKEFIDIDKHYHLKIKTIYGQIIDFSTKAQAQMNEVQLEEIYKLKLASRNIVQAIKDTKHLQKNIIKYSNDSNKLIQKEYQLLIKELLQVLRDIKSIEDIEDSEEIILTLSTVKLKIEKYDKTITKSIDNLIRNSLVTHEMATSLMNDSSYVYDIANNLINMAEILFVDQDLAEDILIDNEDIKEYLEN